MVLEEYVIDIDGIDVHSAERNGSSIAVNHAFHTLYIL